LDFQLDEKDQSDTWEILTIFLSKNTLHNYSSLKLLMNYPLKRPQTFLSPHPCFEILVLIFKNSSIDYISDQLLFMEFLRGLEYYYQNSDKKENLQNQFAAVLDAFENITECCRTMFDLLLNHEYFSKSSKELRASLLLALDRLGMKTTQEFIFYKNVVEIGLRNGFDFPILILNKLLKEESIVEMLEVCLDQFMTIASGSMVQLFN
jgi:acyl-CoA synthetase (AMP-forming)/AMP-acid ligase II